MTDPTPTTGKPGETPFEQFERLAKEFYRETGIWPPGKYRAAAEGDDGISSIERQRRWRGWNWREWNLERAKATEQARP